MVLFFCPRGHQAIAERDSQVFSFSLDLESVATLAGRVVSLDHYHEALLNLQSSNIDLNASGVRVEKLLYLVMVFRGAKESKAERAERDGPERGKEGAGGEGSSERGEGRGGEGERDEPVA